MYAWRQQVYIPATLEGWPEVPDPADQSEKKKEEDKDKMMEFIFDGTTQIKPEIKPAEGAPPAAEVWATPFSADTNYNAIKIEAGGPDQYSKVYELDKNSGDSLQKQIKDHLEKDFFLKYEAESGRAAASLAAYRDKIMAAGGFSIYINDIVTGTDNLAAILYDRSFHVETFTYDMLDKVAFPDLNLKPRQVERQDYETTDDQWENAFIKPVTDNIKDANREKYFAVHIDKYMHDDVIPLLKCKSPCYNCFDNEPTFCTSCWGLGPEVPGKRRNQRLYLQSRAATAKVGQDGSIRAVSTCLDKCDSGYSINGEAVGVKMATATKRGAEYKLTNLSSQGGSGSQHNQSIFGEINLEHSYFKCQ